MPAATENDLVTLVNRLSRRTADDVVLGIGDDAAVLKVPPGELLLTCTDTLVEGVHFPLGTNPSSIGHKSLAVNLSDIAAMGGIPRWAQLAITLPRADAEWLTKFMQGFQALADRHNVVLVGGDTCKGPLSITVQMLGSVPEQELLTRGSAGPGDLIAVSGHLGDAALALQRLTLAGEVAPALLERLNEPQPRVALGRALAGTASSCIDLSDGLLIDLGRMLQGSGHGADLQLPRLPASAELRKLSDELRWPLQLAGGDDYELCFTLNPGRSASLAQIAEETGTPLQFIGEVSRESGIRCFDAHANQLKLHARGYEHFEDPDDS